jgi:hypothetical protein
VSWMHLNALRERNIAPNAKNKFNVSCSVVLLLGSTPGPPDHEK